MKKEEMIYCKACGKELAKSAKVCPNCGMKNKKKPIALSILVGLFAMVILMAIIGSITGDDTTAAEVQPAAGTTEQAQAAEVQPTIVYTPFTVDKLVDDLEENAMKAEATYQDQYIELSGKLSNIDSDGKYIQLDPFYDDWNFTIVQCYLKGDEQKAVVMEMKKGCSVIVKGKVSSIGEIMGYSIDIDSISIG